MVYGYIRVSTSSQNTLNQKMVIENYCSSIGEKVDLWIEDVMSGTKDPCKRLLGKEIMEKCSKGDKIFCTEISRLGRSLLMILNTMEFFREHGVDLFSIKDNINLSNDLVCKVLSFAFGLSAEIERQLISERTKAALKRIRQQGIHVGRKKGMKNRHYKLDCFSDYIEENIKKGTKTKEICAYCGVSYKTLKSFLNRKKIK